MGEVKRAKVLHTSLPHSLPVRKSLHQFLPFEYWGEGEQKMVRAVRLSGDASLSAETSHSLPMFICTIDYFFIFFHSMLWRCNHFLLLRDLADCTQCVRLSRVGVSLTEYRPCANQRRVANELYPLAPPVHPLLFHFSAANRSWRARIEWNKRIKEKGREREQKRLMCKTCSFFFFLLRLCIGLTQMERSKGEP